MKTGVTVQEVMTTNVLCAEPGVKVIDCAKLMAKHDVGSIVICEGLKVVGILTEQDLTRKIMAVGIDPIKTLVKEIVPKKIYTIEPKKDIYDAMIEMEKHKIKHLPVVQNDELVGIITVKDIIRVQPGLIEVLQFKEELGDEERKKIFH